jgi:hypothetical protein
MFHWLYHQLYQTTLRKLPFKKNAIDKPAINLVFIVVIMHYRIDFYKRNPRTFIRN